MNFETRLHKYRDGRNGTGPVVYWMSRDQRVSDNSALIFAQKTARQEKSNLVVVFCLMQEFLGAGARQYDFMAKGLEKIKNKLLEHNIPFCLIKGKPEDEIPRFCHLNDISLLVTDFDPLLIKKNWKNKITGRIEIPFFEVDTHNIIPCRIASPKQEWAAYTMRPKINRLLGEYLVLPENPSFHTLNDSGFIEKYSRFPEKLFSGVSANPNPVDWIKPGEDEALKMLNNFIQNNLETYSKEKNDPIKGSVSNLSPYLHFGMISPLRVANEVKNARVNETSKAAFLEELVVRRELADNYCYYNENYDNFEGITDWAKMTLNLHRMDIREHIYTMEQFENGATHDPLWNAAQAEMVGTGKMHGYMRMYWAKKILEWTESPEEAFDTAVYLNDKYQLDGRDPNGYTGIAWSIGGIHDRPWPERSVFGKIRYMNYNGMKKKFDTAGYILKNTPVRK